MTEPIQFERHTEAAAFFSPLAGMEFTEDRIEVRTDPLTGMTAIASAGLEAKEEMFLGKTDWAYTDLLVARSREGCFFCPEKVLEATPRYPDALVPGGRLERGRALVFPNLFPLAGVHAVVTFPEKHFLRPSEFTPSLLEEGLGAALDFSRRAAAFYPAHDAHRRVLQPHAARRGQPRAPAPPGVRRRDRALAGQALLGPLGRLARAARGELLADARRPGAGAGRALRVGRGRRALARAVRAGRRPRGARRRARRRAPDRPRRRARRGAGLRPHRGSSPGTRTRASRPSTSRCRAGHCTGARPGSPSSRASSPAPPSSRTTAPTTTSCRSSSAVSSCSPRRRRWRRGCRTLF